MKKTLTVAGLTVALLLVAATSAPADLRTRTIRLVADQDWNAEPTAIRVSLEVVPDDPQAREFGAKMESYLDKAFEKLGYSVSDSAPVQVRFTIDEFDKGKWVKRYFKGDGIILGSVVVTSGGQTVGKFRYSSRLRGGITGTSLDMMAKEVGPPLVLKLDDGERDEHLHGED